MRCRRNSLEPKAFAAPHAIPRTVPPKTHRARLQHRQHFVEQLWSRAVAAERSPLQTLRTQDRRKQAETVAIGMVRNAMKKGLPGDRLRFVTGSYRRGGPLRCCTPDWISVASVSTSTCSTQMVRPSTSARHRLTQTDSVA